ncbi:MAG: SDR family oxidoreductase [Chloroflexi bacterium]|nr:SDR family oxidoreductase [Chloroflexota bacterium]
MDLGLKGRVAIVTGGGGRNMGSEFCRTFAQEGANVVVVDVAEDAAQAVAKECQGLGVKALGLKVDITKPEEAQAMAKKVMDTFDRIDILVNSAFVGQNGRFLKIEPVSKEWHTTMDVCYYGTMNCTWAVLPHMIEGKWGRVVSMGSDAGRVGDPVQPLYAAAKGAIIAWNKSLAIDQGPTGTITFNVVCASLTSADTPEGRARREQFMGGPERVQEILRRFYPMRKFGTPQEMAAMVVFVASERGSHLTGQTISVNGGYCML